MSQLDLKKIDTNTLQKILNACEQTFPTELNVKDFYGESQTTWSIPEIGLVYKDTSSKKDLLLFVETLTETDHIRQAYAKIYEEIEARRGLPNKDVPVQPDRTTVTEKTDEGMFGDLKRQEEQLRQTRENQKKIVEKAIKDGKEKYEAQQNLKVDEIPQPDRTPEQQQKTTLNKDELEQLQVEADKREKQTKETVKNSEDAIAAATKRKQELFEEEKNQKIRQAIAEKKVVVIPVGEIKSVELTDQEKEILIIITQAAKEDPKTLQKFIETRIVESLQIGEGYPVNITPDDISRTSFAITQQLAGLPTYKNVADVPKKMSITNPTSPIVALANANKLLTAGVIPENNKDIAEAIAEAAQTLSLGIESQTAISYAAAEAVFGKNIAQALNGPADGEMTYFEIVNSQNQQKEKEEDKGEIKIDLEELYEKGKKFEKVWNNIQAAKEIKTAETVYSSTTSIVPSYSTPTTTKTITKDFAKTSKTYTSLVGGYPYTGKSAETIARLTKYLPAVTTPFSIREGILLSRFAKASTPLLGGAQSFALLTAGSSVSRQGGILLASSQIPNYFVAQQSFGQLTFRFVSSIKNTTEGVNTLYTASVAVGEKGFGAYFGQLATKSGVKVGAGTITAKASGQVIAKAVPAAVLSKLGAVVAGLASPLGAIVGFVGGEIIGKLISKIDWAKAKKFMTETVLPLFVGGGLVFAGFPAVGIVAGGLIYGVARGATFASMSMGVFAFFAAVGKTIGIAIATPVIVTLLIIPPLVAFIMLIINNSAYLVPPIQFETGEGGYTPEKCLGDPPEKPIATNIKYSSDGKYAFPTAPFESPGYHCYHWDGYKSVDIFSNQDKPPMVAYESGTISNVTLDDEIGGKYIILKGQSGRYYYYAHLCHVFVNSGEEVNVGDVIGTMDETGSGRVQHLHYAINESPLSDTFIGGDGNVCPQEDFEEKFGFGVCNTSNYCVNP